MFTKEQLIERSKVYFDNNNITKIFATSDGNFFYDEHYARGHASGNDVQFYVVLRGDLPIKEPLSKDEIKNLLTEKGIKFHPNSGIKKLLELLNN